MSNNRFSNNFDLIRLLAATQVAFCHATELLCGQYYFAAWFEFLKLFPGVPIFFFISGFLISKSFENNGNLKDYALNRMLRIYPALLVCNALAMLAVFVTGYLDQKAVSSGQIAIWYAAQSSFIQFYNPDFMRAFGVGVLNGSLWTICVELQFYILIPMIYRTLTRLSARYFLPAILLLIVISLIANRVLYAMEAQHGQTVYWKLARVSFLPWLYMFLTGLIFQKYIYPHIKVVTNPQFLGLLAIYLPFAWYFYQQDWTFNNGVSPIIFLPLVVLIYAAAHAFPNLSERWLHKNDISYGVYIYHMPLVNLFLYFGLSAELKYPLLITLLAMMLGALSWWLIEKPILRYKKNSLLQKQLVS